MMKVASFDIVFQEIPDEVTLALNISQCPCHCLGCHSPHLWEDTGEELTQELIDGLINTYHNNITCVCIMGGDAMPKEVNRWLQYIHTKGLKTAWYSGRDKKAPFVSDDNLDYIKLGSYQQDKGGLKQPTTNQRLYKRLLSADNLPINEVVKIDNSNSSWLDITSRFWKK